MVVIPCVIAKKRSVGDCELTSHKTAQYLCRLCLFNVQPAREAWDIPFARGFPQEKKRFKLRHRIDAFEKEISYLLGNLVLGHSD
jgi:hypothetical protein